MNGNPAINATMRGHEHGGKGDEHHA